MLHEMQEDRYRKALQIKKRLVVSTCNNLHSKLVSVIEDSECVSILFENIRVKVCYIYISQRKNR